MAFELTSAESAELPAGDYVAFLTVTIDGNRETLSRSTVEVLPNPATASGDLRSSTKRIIDALTEVLEGRASDGVLERSVDGVTLKYASPDTLRRMLESYKMRYALEQGESVLPGAIVTKGVIR